MKKHTLFIFFLVFSTLNSIAQIPSLNFALQMGGNGADFADAITIDNQGNIYTTGFFFSQTADFDPSSNSFILSSTNSSHFYISKLDENGNFIWAVSASGTTGISNARDIITDKSGNVYIIGDFFGTVDFDPSTGVTNLTSTSLEDIFIMKLDSTGSFLWVKQIEGSGRVEFGKSIAVDIYDNIYATGYYEDSADFDPGINQFILTTDGSLSAFLLKLNSRGEFKWATQFGGVSLSRGESIAINSNGDIFTVGVFSGTADFDPSSNIQNLTAVGNNDIFISKLDSTGSFIFAKKISPTGVLPFHQVNHVYVDNEDKIYLTGRFEGTSDFDPSSNVFALTAKGRWDAFICKLNTNGDLEWAKQVEGTDYSMGKNISVDKDKNVYFIGDYNDSADFNPSSSIYQLNSSGEEDVFVSKLDSLGNFVWAISYGGTGEERGEGIALDNQNNVYTTGFFENTVDFAPDTVMFNLTSFGNEDIFIQKLSQDESVSVEEKYPALSSKAYPNPTKENLTIELGKEYKTVQVKIVFMTGQLNSEITYHNVKDIDLSIKGKSGFYIIQIETESGLSSSFKILKE